MFEVKSGSPLLTIGINNNTVVEHFCLLDGHIELANVEQTLDTSLGVFITENLLFKGWEGISPNRMAVNILAFCLDEFHDHEEGEHALLLGRESWICHIPE